MLLVVNVGSSSLKLRLLGENDELLENRDLPAPRDEQDFDHLREAVQNLPTPDVVAHRIVHGGTEFTEAVFVDEDVEQRLRDLVPLAPLHQPQALAAMKTTMLALPSVSTVACFDTAFHRHMPASATTYPLPREWNKGWNIKRYGFHGLSHAYVSRRAAELAATPLDDLRIVSCHLGAGASLAAVAGGRSVDTTMGFTPLEGLVMATRSGDVDPGLLLWLQEFAGVSLETLRDTLEHRSGLCGLADQDDMEAILQAIEAGDQDAQLAVDVYIHRLRAKIGAMTAAMDGLDAIVFTGGIGEHSPEIRSLTVNGLRFLGLQLDAERNDHANADMEISTNDSAVRAYVITSREDLEMAREVRQLIGS